MSGNITLWTTTRTDNDLVLPPIIFRPYEFSVRTTGLVQKNVSHVVESIAKVPGSSGLSISIVEIHDVAPWLPQVLEDAFPGFPLDLLRPMLQSPDFNNALLPLGRSAVDFSFFIRYAAVEDKDTGENATPARTFDSCEVRSIPVAVWISSSKMILSDAQQSKPPIPVIVIVCQHSLVRMKLSQHLAREYPRKLRRLMESPAWIYLDLSFVLSQWQEVWELANGSIVLRDAQLTGKASTASFLDLTQRLHHDCNSVVMLQEGLRLHVSAMKAFQRFVKAHRTEEKRNRFSSTHGGSGLGGAKLLVVASKHQVELENRVEDYLQNLENNQETSKVVFKQLEILQSLAFNTETVRQGYAVARLNYLAVAFLPLSFIASLFGMTEWAIGPVWYPLWAFICIALVVGIGTTFHKRNRTQSTRDKSRPWAFQQWEMPILRLRSSEDSTSNQRRASVSSSVYGFGNLVNQGNSANSSSSTLVQNARAGFVRSANSSQTSIGEGPRIPLPSIPEKSRSPDVPYWPLPPSRFKLPELRETTWGIRDSTKASASVTAAGYVPPRS